MEDTLKNMSDKTLKSVIEDLKRHSNPEFRIKMERFGINNSRALGIKIPEIRKLAQKTGKNHQLALELWETEIHEARLLAGFIDEPEKVSIQQFDKWVNDFDSWDICDQTCSLLVKTTFAADKIETLSNSKNEFVKRTSFVLMCAFAVHYKKLDDSFFYPFFDIIEKQSVDDRNFVKKAVNWALRQIGKRNDSLRIKAIECAQMILQKDSKPAQWIAKDALRELNNPKIISMVQKKTGV